MSSAAVECTSATKTHTVVVISTECGAGQGLIMPFMVLQLRTLGLSMTDASMVNGLSPVLVGILTPPAGYLGDKVGYRAILAISLIAMVKIRRGETTHQLVTIVGGHLRGAAAAAGLPGVPRPGRVGERGLGDPGPKQTGLAGLVPAAGIFVVRAEVTV